MRTLRSLLLAGLAALLLLPAPAPAQSDILLRLRSGSPPGDRFRVDSAGGLVAIGELGIGIIPASGEGYRLMWAPYHASFRAGHADTEWDFASMGFFSWAGGNNTMASQYATFAFGDNTDATANYAVAFGNNTIVSGFYGFGAGLQARCAQSGCVAVGYVPNADGDGAVALGYRVTADADYSTALGYRASTNGHHGAFVISDASTTDSTEASANNQFSGRFAGGWRFFTNATKTTGVALNAGSSSFTVISDRNRKEAFTPVDGEDVLARIRHIPVREWRFIGAEAGVRHIGPMAQDWHAAFPLNDDPLGIDMSDFDGVNLAAVQALERRTAEQAARISDLEARNAELEARLARLEARLGADPPR